MTGRLKIKLEVRGALSIQFEEGWRTGDMTEGGLGIDTEKEQGVYIGGCINREEATQLRDFLNKCILKWKLEKL